MVSQESYPERLAAALAYYAEHGNLREACQAAHISYRYVFDLKKDDPELAAGLKAAEAAFLASVRREAEAGRAGRARPAEAQPDENPAAALEWRPMPGPQTEAYDSPADILLYGGAAGGGKSDLLLGLALTRHKRAIVFRREYPQLKALEDRACEIAGPAGKYSGDKRMLRLPGNRRLEFGAVQLEHDMRRFQGRPHDLTAFDEITHFTETQFRFLIGWNRSPEPGQRVRMVAAGNPPTTTEGSWVIKYWAPWLDPRHPNPAKPGELRWYATIDGEERELPSGEPFEHKGEMIRPLSRSFIPARVEDNRYMMQSGYKATLQSLPEPLRSRLLHGDFSVGQADAPDQVIPTAWIRRAQDRWTHAPPDNVAAMTAIGVDVARGGRDRTVLIPRHGVWFGRALTFPGQDTPDGKVVAQRIIDLARSHVPIVQIDVIGVGGSVYDLVQLAGLKAVALSSAGASPARDRTGQLSFVNRRAEWWWSLREALDPDLGLPLMLPPDPELLADLAAPGWELTGHGIKIEGKDAIRQRLGRSTDKGDALIYAWATPQEPALFRLIAQEMAELRRAEAEAKARPSMQVVARTTRGQPAFAFNPDGSRRPEEDEIDPATVKPGPWYRWTRDGRFQLLDPWAKHKR